MDLADFVAHSTPQTNFSLPELTLSDLTGNDDAFLSALTSLESTRGANNDSTTMDMPVALVPHIHGPNTIPQYYNGVASMNPLGPKSNGQAKRKRSSIACRACHTRRVRCDAAARGLPCSNCQLRAIECVLIDSKRYRSKCGRFEGRNENRVGGPSASNQELKIRSDQADDNNTALPDKPLTPPALDFPRRSTSSSTSTGNDNLSTVTSQIVHVGESSLFSWLLSSQTNTNPPHHRMMSEKHRTDVVGLGLYLNQQPPKVSTNLEHSLLESFEQNFLPLYPIIKKDLVFRSWNSGTISPLLKQSILFTGAVHAEESVISAAGFSCRQDATELLYNKARQLYDSDIEMDQITILQSMFMLQFRFGSSPGHRDCFWWTGAAINLAQSIGIHRSTKGTTVSPEDQLLWKRIWWLLYIRDRQLGLGIGRPLMIDERYCDVEELTVDDFTDSDSLETAQFTISMVQLSKIVTDVVGCKFSPASSCTGEGEDTKLRLHLALQGWHAGLVPCMRYDRNANCSRFGLLLSLVYHQTILLLHRPRLCDVKNASSQRDFSTRLAFYAAAKICDHANDILKFFKVNEFPIYAEMIILSAVAFHSVETDTAMPQETHATRKRNATYNSCLRELDRIFYAIPRYKLIFGEGLGIWKKLTPSGEGQAIPHHSFERGYLSESEEETSDLSD